MKLEIFGDAHIFLGSGDNYRVNFRVSCSNVVGRIFSLL